MTQSVKLCGLCPNNNRQPLPADMYCVGCKIFICSRCIRSHELRVQNGNHSYVSTAITDQYTSQAPEVSRDNLEKFQSTSTRQLSSPSLKLESVSEESPAEDVEEEGSSGQILSARNMRYLSLSRSELPYESSSLVLGLNRHDSKLETVSEEDVKNYSRNDEDLLLHTHSEEELGFVSEYEKIIELYPADQEPEFTEDLLDVRNIEGSFCEMMKNLELVNTATNLSDNLYRIGVVNDHLWLIDQAGEFEINHVAVYNQEPKQVAILGWKNVHCINMAQQISTDDVMVLTCKGLHVVDTEGQYQYKVMNGHFSDLSLNSSRLAVVECKQNKVVILEKQSENRWKPHYDIDLDETEETIKTLQLCADETAFVAISSSHRIIKISLKQAKKWMMVSKGGTNVPCDLGEFDQPSTSVMDEEGCLVVSDCGNDRFMVLYPGGKWEEVRVKGIYNVKDIVAVAGSVFILHRDKSEASNNMAISKFEIQETEPASNSDIIAMVLMCLFCIALLAIYCISSGKVKCASINLIESFY